MMNQENRYLLKFAWKNISRHKGRSFFIGFSVVLSVCIAIWVMAFFDGLNHQIEEAVVQTNTGYFQIQEINYSSTTDSETPLLFDEKTADLIQSNKDILSFSPELVLDGNISTPEGVAAFNILGISPKYHSKFLPIASNIISGAFLQEEGDGIIIGKELANVFKFNIGDQMVINYQDVNGELRSELLTISGIYQFNSKIFEKRFVYISQRKWQELYLNEVKSPLLFHRISIMTENLEAEPKIKNLSDSLGLNLKTWKNINPEMAVVIDFHHGMINFFFCIIAITITMTILTPVRMLWQERMKEMKMMVVLGIPQKGLWKLGLFEVFWMILLSGGAAAVVIYLLVTIQSYTGIDFAQLNNGVAVERAGIQLPTVVFPRTSAAQLLMTFGFVIFTLLISYTWSISRTMKKMDSAL